jgi:hypothetical protein
MTNSQRLTLFIETALKHGGELTPYDPARGDTWEAQEYGVAFYNRDGEMYLFIPVSTLLYGNDCGLLKAACGEDEMPWEVQVNGGWADKKYQWVAAHSVLYPDSKRLQFVLNHLCKD